MLTLVLILIFLICAGVLWFQGLWSNAIALINLLFAAMLALNFFEPVSDQIEKSMGSYKYLIDFLVFWGIFALGFGFLRAITDFASRKNVTFNIWVEMAGRTILSVWIAWLFVGLILVSMHTAPLAAHPMGFQEKPQSGNFLGLAPGRVWLGFMQSRSRDTLKGKTEFDPDSVFMIKYYHRRVEFEGVPGYRN